jgi:hypothetical protein
MREQRRKEIIKWARDVIISVALVPAALAYFQMSPLVIIVGGACSLIILTAWENWSFIRTKARLLTIKLIVILGSAAVLALATGAVWIFGILPLRHASPDPVLALVAEEFDRAKLPGLGAPTGKIETTNGMYQASHERAMVVALLPVQDIFIFPKDRARKGIRYHYAATEDARKWWDDTFLRSQFKPPKDKKPPEAIVAVAWAANPDQFKWIGWREWSCPFVIDKFYYQTFENGVIFGVLPTNETLGSSQIFTFLNTGEWSSIEPIDKAGGLSAPGCNENTARTHQGVVVHGRFTKPPPKP